MTWSEEAHSLMHAGVLVKLSGGLPNISKQMAPSPDMTRHVEGVGMGTEACASEQPLWRRAVWLSTEQSLLRFF